MRTITIKEALAYEDGETIPAIEGKVVWAQPLDKVHRGTGKGGEYTYQDIGLAVPGSTRNDPDSSIVVVIKNRLTQDAKDKGRYLDGAGLVGKEVSLESYKGAKGLAGVVKLVQTSGDKIYHKIGFSGNVRLLGEDSHIGSTAGDEGGAASESTQSEKSHPAGAQTPSRHNPAMVGMCVKMAGDFALNGQDGPSFDPAHIKAMAKELMKVCVELESTPLD